MNPIEIAAFVVLVVSAAVIGHILYKVAIKIRELSVELGEYRVQTKKDILEVKNEQVEDVAKIIKRLDQHEWQSTLRGRDLYRQIMCGLEVDRMTEPGASKYLRGWAISPDALLEIFKYLDEFKPKLILELGGGYSTQIIRLYIRKNKLDTRIVTVDHDSEYLDKTEAMSGNEGIQYIHAPLKSYDAYSWYDADKINSSLKKQRNKCDLIIVDGPPQRTNENARMPLLDKIDRSLIAKNYSIILDDAAREDEARAVEMWLSTDTTLSHQYIRTEKGLSILSTKGLLSKGSRAR